MLTKKVGLKNGKIEMSASMGGVKPADLNAVVIPDIADKGDCGIGREVFQRRVMEPEAEFKQIGLASFFDIESDGNVNRGMLLDFKIGDIVLLESPYASKGGSKYRPGLVLNVDNIHQDLLVGFMTSEVDSYFFDENAVLIKNGDLAEGRLGLDSVVRVDKTVVVNKGVCKWVAGVKREKLDQILRKMAHSVTRSHYHAIHKKDNAFKTGGRINYAGRIYDEREMLNLVDAALEFWLTHGVYSKAFEEKIAEFVGIKYAFLVNSGSSANLLAFMALTSHLLEDRRIKRGDEVITVAAGFPTTVAPVIQYGAVPVFVDIDLGTFNVDVTQLEEAVSPKTKAVMLAHTLGNPFDIRAVKTFCENKNLWLIEDNCDALGSRYLSEEFWSGHSPNSTRHGRHPKSMRLTGSFGDIGTSSFYPPHHMTMGEGGAVYTNDNILKRILLSMRDWGRDCRCDTGKDNTCGNRFTGRHGTLPFGYDHKYVYSHFGYNLKPTDMQAAVGCAQLEKLPGFIKKRKANFEFLYEGLKDLQEIFMLPEATPNSDPSWFGFLLTLKDGVFFTRNEIVNHLEDGNIQTRNLFAGNLIRHPCFSILKAGEDFRVAGKLKNTDKIMNDGFWLGLYPGMTEEMMEFMIGRVRSFVLSGI